MAQVLGGWRFALDRPVILADISNAIMYFIAVKSITPYYKIGPVMTFDLPIKHLAASMIAAM
jgi:hypothetical protein